MKHALTMVVLAALSIAVLFAASPESESRNRETRNAEPLADSGYRADYFYFQTTGTIKPLLSESTYKAVLAAAKAAGYSEEEIEVTLYVVDRKSREERRFIPTATRQKLEKPKVKKFE